MVNVLTTHIRNYRYVTPPTQKCTLSSASGELSTGIVGSMRCGLESLYMVSFTCIYIYIQQENFLVQKHQMHAHSHTCMHTHTHTHTLCTGYTHVIHLQVHSDVFHFLCCPVVLLWMLEPVAHCLLPLYL